MSDTHVAPRTRAASTLPSGMTSYVAASTEAQNISLWRPHLRSADAEILRDHAKVRARARDLVRNHPYARQAVRISRLGVMGKRLRFSCRPDWRFLGIDQDESIRWAQEFERIWENYSHSRHFYIDARRQMSFSEQAQLEHDCEFVDGEYLTVAEWAEGRRWRTAFQVVDVDRLSNPAHRPETATLRAGVELDEMGGAVGYHIRNRHPNDRIGFDMNADSWRFVPRETPWGRMIATHSFEHNRPEQTRGISEFASVIVIMKMGAEYTQTALEAAILQASYAAVLQSQQNYREALEVLGETGDPDGQTVVDLAEQNLESAVQHYQDINFRFNGAKVPILHPGDELKLLTPGQKATGLGEFQQHATREYAAGTGTDPIQVSQDYSQVNYSSAKMSVAANYRHFESRRERWIQHSGLPKVAAFLEELVFDGGMWLPKGLSIYDFYDFQDALARGTFITQGAPNLDPLKEINAAEKEMKLGLMSAQDWCAARGEDHIDKFDQVMREERDRAERGLPSIDPMASLMAAPNDGAGAGGDVEPAE